MKYKIMLTAFVALALMFTVIPMVLAENETIVNETDSLDESEQELELNETVNDMTILGQQIKIWFTLNKENKIDAELKLARLRLIQANIAARNNNTIAMQRALEAHERIINRVQERINGLDGSNRFAELNRTAFRLVGLQRAIQVHERRILRIQDNLNDSNLTEQEREVLESRLEKAQNNTAHLIQVSEDKKDEIKDRLREVRNLTEEEAEDIVEQGRENRNRSWSD